MIEVRWHGRGGQGGFTAARLLGMAAAEFGDKYALAFPSFGPERRGAPVLGFTKLSDQKITDRSELQTCDYVIVLDETLIDESIVKGLTKNGRVFVNTQHPEKYPILQTVPHIAFDATSTALSILERPITNTAMLGLLVAHTSIVTFKSLIDAIKISFKGKSALLNIEIVQYSFNLVGEKKSNE